MNAETAMSTKEKTGRPFYHCTCAVSTPPGSRGGETNRGGGERMRAASPARWGWRLRPPLHLRPQQPKHLGALHRRRPGLLARRAAQRRTPPGGRLWPRTPGLCTAALQLHCLPSPLTAAGDSGSLGTGEPRCTGTRGAAAGPPSSPWSRE